MDKRAKEELFEILGFAGVPDDEIASVSEDVIEVFKTYRRRARRRSEARRKIEAELRGKS